MLVKRSAMLNGLLISNLRRSYRRKRQRRPASSNFRSSKSVLKSKRSCLNREDLSEKLLLKLERKDNRLLKYLMTNRLISLTWLVRSNHQLISMNFRKTFKRLMRRKRRLKNSSKRLRR